MMGGNPALDTVKNVLNQERVRISFDIDDTLACQPHHSAAEDSSCRNACTVGWVSRCAMAMRWLHAGCRTRLRSCRPPLISTCTWTIPKACKSKVTTTVSVWLSCVRMMSNGRTKSWKPSPGCKRNLPGNSDRAGTRCLRRSIRVSPLTAEGFQELCVLQHLGKHRQREFLGGLLLFAGEGCRAVGQGDHVVALFVA